MFGAVGRFFRSFWYMVTGRVDEAGKNLQKNPYVIQETYSRIVEDKKRSIDQYKDAVAAMVAQQEKKLSAVKRLSDEIKHLETLRQGAAAKAKAEVERLKAQGVPMELIKQNEDYMKCLAAFNDFSSTVAEKNARVQELEADIETLSKNVGGHKVQLQQLLREIDKLKEEASATVADMITAKEEETIANMVAGISNEKYSRELQNMREMRDQSRAKAKVSRELAGTDTKRQEAEFMEYAQASVSSSEFDKLIGLAEATETDALKPVSETGQKTQLPER